MAKAKATATAPAPRNASARRVSARPGPVAVPDPEPEVEQEEPAGYSEDEVEEGGEEGVSEEELELLREEALQHEVEYDDETTVEELREKVEAAKQKEVEAHKAQKAEAARMRAMKPVEDAATTKAETPKAKGASGRTGGKAKASALDELKSRIRQPDPIRMQANKLPEPSLADYQLADQHGYPVAIPGAKAYRISISILCPFGGGERPAGSIMLIHPIFSANKLEYLTPV